MNKWRLHSSRLGNVLQRKKTFFKILLLTGVCTLTVVLVMFTMMYQSVRAIITQQSIDMSVQTFNQIQAIVDSMSRTVNSLATQILLEDSCSQLLLADDSDLNPLSAYTGVRQLTLYKNINDSIDSIYIYNRNADHIFTTEGKTVYKGIDSFYDTQLLEIVDNFQEYKGRVLIKRRIYKHDGNAYAGDRDVYTYIIGNMYRGDQLINAVVINISADWLVNTLLESQNLERSIMEVIDSKEKQPLVTIQGIQGVDRDAFRQPVLELAAENKPYSEYTYNGSKYFISYQYSSKLDWSFVKVSEWDVVFDALNQLQKGLLLVVGVIAFVCVVISVFGAGSIYRLFRIIEVNYNKLVGIKRSDSIKRRDSFMWDYLGGAKAYTAAQLSAKLEELDLPLNLHTPYKLVVLKIENYQALGEHYGQAALYGIKYGLRNIFEEISQPYFGVVGVLGRENHLPLILYAREGAVLTRELIATAFDQFCTKTKVFIDGSYSLVATQELTHLTELPLLWRKLLPTLRNTFFYPANSYIAYEAMLQEHSRALDGRQLEHHILQSLLAGSWEETVEQYRSFADAIAQCGFDDYINTMTWLGFSIARAVSDFQVGGQVNQRSYFNDFLVKLLVCQKREAVDRLFEEIFTQALQVIRQANIKTGASGKIEEILRYIEQSYTDVNLTQEAISEEFGISTSYLGKLFRRANALSVAEYINQVRLSHVVEQMAATNQSTKEIAQNCGFSGVNYFYTYFKKKYGITPQAYRERLRQQNVE